ncbi:19298_t:CDS:2 [Rhizophagus irregularis]|nr:19298_t:CDS:2 [Rhizophagus irregularis]
MNVDNNIPCQWMYTLEGNCKEKNLLIKILNISAICYGILALKNVFFIIWRVYLRKVEKRGCAPLDYMVTFAFIFNLLRSVDNFIVVYNLFPEAIIFRVSFFAISWIPGATVIYLYLAVVFRTIPRLILHRLTCKENTLWILNTKKITPVLWTLSTITSIGLISSSVLAVKLTRESLTLAGMNDERKDIEKKKFDIYIHKMKMFNYIFGGISLLEFKSRNLEGRKEPVHSTWMQTEISYQNLSRHI